MTPIRMGYIGQDGQRIEVHIPNAIIRSTVDEDAGPFAWDISISWDPKTERRNYFSYVDENGVVRHMTDEEIAAFTAEFQDGYEDDE